MNTAWKLETPATEEPMSLAQAMDHVHATNTADRTSVERALRGARHWLEQYLQRGLTTQTWKYAQDAWTDTIRLPMGAPLQSVASVKYYDAAGALQTLSTAIYGFDTLSEPGFVYLKPNQMWPVLEVGRPLAVEITYIVGWADLDLIPGDILDGLYLLLGDRFTFREQRVTGTIVSVVLDVQRMLAGRRVVWPVNPCNAWDAHQVAS